MSQNGNVQQETHISHNVGLVVSIDGAVGQNLVEWREVTFALIVSGS